MNRYAALTYHLIFATKQRVPTLPRELMPTLYAYVGGCVKRHHGVLLAAGGMPDHVHLLLSLRPEPSLVKHIQEIKGGSSRWLGERLESFYGWQRGYAVFTVSASQVATVRRYVERQEAHHAGRGYGNELAALLRRHGLDPTPEEALLGQSGVTPP